MDGSAEVVSHEAASSPVTPQEQREQLQKVLHSETFKAARGLQKFLDYVASKTIAGLSSEIKEYTIGSEVFGRASDSTPLCASRHFDCGKNFASITNAKGQRTRFAS